MPTELSYLYYWPLLSFRRSLSYCFQWRDRINSLCLIYFIDTPPFFSFNIILAKSHNISASVKAKLPHHTVLSNIKWLRKKSPWVNILNCDIGVINFMNPVALIIFTNASVRAGYDTRSGFKRSLTGLNSEFSFSSNSCRRTQSALLFTHSWRENNWIHILPKGISAMWNAISLVQDLNSCRRVHFLRR